MPSQFVAPELLEIGVAMSPPPPPLLTMLSGTPSALAWRIFWMMRGAVPAAPPSSGSRATGYHPALAAHATAREESHQQPCNRFTVLNTCPSSADFSMACG